jgi:hypothetical protein
MLHMYKHINIHTYLFIKSNSTLSITRVHPDLSCIPLRTRIQYSPLTALFSSFNYIQISLVHPLRTRIQYSPLTAPFTHFNVDFKPPNG